MDSLRVSLEELPSFISKWLGSKRLNAQFCFFLEGDLGAGKSTFARALLRYLGVTQFAEGSPTFSLMHVYPKPPNAPASIVHMDFYRLEEDDEIEHSGMAAAIWEDSQIVLTEWLSRFPFLKSQIVIDRTARGGECWEIQFKEFGQEGSRQLTLTKLLPEEHSVGKKSKAKPKLAR